MKDKRMTNGELAIRNLTRAKKSYKDASSHRYFDPVAQNEAKELEKVATELLKVEGVRRLTGGEAVELGTESDRLFQETLQDPNSVSIDASVHRLSLLEDRGCLPLAVDASETIQARNSLEKMLAHQMALCHHLSMRLLSKAVGFTSSLTASYADPDTEKAVKALNAAGRLMDLFQRGLATIVRIRTAGAQKVIVEHVHVNAGGQAIVGAINHGGGGSREGEDEKFEGTTSCNETRTPEKRQSARKSKQRPQMWREDAKGNRLQVPCNGKREMQNARGEKHRTPNPGRTGEVEKG